MFYSNIDKCSIAEMPGCCVTLFVSGCLPNKCKEGNCPGCHNEAAQKFYKGTYYTEETEQEILEACSKSYISGLCLCGGEPFDQSGNYLINLAYEFKKSFPEKKLWCYTGYKWEQIKNKALTAYLDAAIVGPFILAQRDISDANRWRGSRNQRVIDVQKSLELNDIIFLEGIPNNT